MGDFYYKNLHRHFFENYPQKATEFIAVSGYIGPDPLIQLSRLPLRSSVIYGLRSENQNAVLEKQLRSIHSPQVSILYPVVPSHAKCYLWLAEGRPIRGLVGSANFSTNGLYNDFRETLIEAEQSELYDIKAYIELLLRDAKACDDPEIPEPTSTNNRRADLECRLELYDPKTAEVQPRAGLNWGFSTEANVTPNDAYIAVRTKHIRAHPELFPPVFFNPEEGHRNRSSKEMVELIWDDGTVMEVLFEGSQPLAGSDWKFPKQISSTPEKSTLGKYIRGRMGLPPVSSSREASERITLEKLSHYGRKYISLRLIQPGIYAADFSPIN